MEKYRLVQEHKASEQQQQQQQPQRQQQQQQAAVAPVEDVSMPTTAATTTTTTTPDQQQQQQAAAPSLQQQQQQQHVASSSSSPTFPEVRITQQGKPRNYISYAMGLFVSTQYKKETCVYTVYILALHYLSLSIILRSRGMHCSRIIYIYIYIHSSHFLLLFQITIIHYTTKYFFFLIRTMATTRSFSKPWDEQLTRL